MVLDLKNLSNPIEFWEYFEKLSQIPRCSGNEKKVREYIKNEAVKFNYQVKIDNAGNLLVTIDQIKNPESIIILQSHMDMVCEKNEGILHDFSKDPLSLKIITLDNKKWITAEGTTLGADNATGMAYSLALMKQIYNGELNFNNLTINLLFTVSEEKTMHGALQINKEFLKCKRLINLDSANEKVIIIGCVGSLLTEIDIKYDKIQVSQIEMELVPIIISVTGLLGGHSGSDIDKGRANAIKLLTKILFKLNNDFPIFISSIDGGIKNNTSSIPREANAVVFIKNVDMINIKKLIESISLEEKKHYFNIEKDINISVLEVDRNSDDFVFSNNFQNKFLNAFVSFPHGPISWHQKFDDIVHSSTNLAFIVTKKNRIKIDSLQRSFNTNSLNEISESIIELFDSTNFKIRSSKKGGIGEWEPNEDSQLLKYAKNTYKEIYNEDAIVTAAHVCLETGIFKNHVQELDMIAIGPTMDFLHSPNERLDILSVERFWNMLIKLLKKL